MKRRRSPRGMTLVEIIIALAVIAVAILGAVSLVSFSMGQDHEAKERMQAMDAAKSVMERIQEASYDNIFTNFNGFAFDVGMLLPPDGDADGRVGRVVVNNSDPELLDVQVFVEWRTLRGKTGLSFRTLITRR